VVDPWRHRRDDRGGMIHVAISIPDPTRLYVMAFSLGLLGSAVGTSAVPSKGAIGSN